MSFLNDFDNSLELELDFVAQDVEILAIIDGALDSIKHQRIVDTNTVTDWLLDIRQIVTSG